MLRMKMTIKVLVLAVTLGGLVAALTPQFAEGARGGARGGGGASRSGPASSGSVNRSHRNNRADRSGNRRDNRRNIGDNRRDSRRDVRDDRHDFREDRVRRHRARHLTYAAFRALSCRTTVVIVNGIRYYGCGDIYYERVYQGSSVVYVIVVPPGY